MKEHGLRGLVFSFMDDCGNLFELTRRKVRKGRDLAEKRLRRAFTHTSSGKNILPDRAFNNFGHNIPLLIIDEIQPIVFVIGVMHNVKKRFLQ